MYEAESGYGEVHIVWNDYPLSPAHHICELLAEELNMPLHQLVGTPLLHGNKGYAGPGRVLYGPWDSMAIVALSQAMYKVINCG